MNGTAEKVIYPDFWGDSSQEISETDTVIQDPAVATDTLIQDPTLDDSSAETQRVDLHKDWNKIPKGRLRRLKRKPQGRQSASRVAILLTSGVTIGILLTFPLFSQPGKSPRIKEKLPEQVTRIAQPEAATAPSTFTVTATDPEANTLLDDTALEAVAAQHTRKAPPASGVVEHAMKQPFKVAPRKYMYLKGTGRAYNGAFSKSLKQPQPSASNSLTVSAPELTRIPGEEERFQPRNGNLQWQGGWEANNPKRNIQLGDAYQDYLRKTLGSGNFQNLSSFQKGSSRMLGSVAGKSRKATGAVRKHSGTSPTAK